MKLREFALELVDESREARVDFRNQTRCVSALYERTFAGLTTEETWKVLVECVPFLAQRERVENPFGVAVVRVAFDWDAFAEASSHQKKELALEALQEGVLAVCAEWGWPTGPFEEAERRVRELRFVNRGIWKKPKSSPNRRLRAEIEYEYELDRFTITMVIRGRDGTEVKRELLVEETPSEFVFDKHLGKLEWLSNSEVVLVPKRGDRALRVAVDA